MKTILLVHDNQEDASLRKHSLERVGFLVQLCSSGSECLEILLSSKPDIIVMDILLKGENGFNMCRKIRERFKPEDLPIILSSTIYRKRIFREEARNAGAQAYLLRPLKTSALVEQIYALTDSVVKTG